MEKNKFKIKTGYVCPDCGTEQNDPSVCYFCNPDAFPDKRVAGCLCYKCKAVVFWDKDRKTVYKMKVGRDEK